MRALVEQTLIGSTVLQFEEVIAEPPNLELCYDLGITHTPSVIIQINGETSGPLYEPVEIAEKIKHAKNTAGRSKEEEEVEKDYQEKSS